MLHQIEDINKDLEMIKEKSTGNSRDEKHNWNEKFTRSTQEKEEIEKLNKSIEIMQSKNTQEKEEKFSVKDIRDTDIQ